MSKLYRAIFGIFIIFCVVSVYINIPAEDRYFQAADEGYYLEFSGNIAEKGPLQFRRLIDYYIAFPETHLFPPPSRIGYISLAAIWLKVWGVSFVNLAKFSFFCYLLFVLLCFHFSRKFFSSGVAYPFTLLLSSSPLMMAMGKRALLESCFNLFCGLAVWTFLDFLLTDKKRSFIICLAATWFTILIKESSLLLLVFFACAFLLSRYYFKRKIPWSYLLGILFVPAAASVFVFEFFCGGFGQFIALVKGILGTHFGSTQESRYALMFGMGPWYRYIMDLLLLSPASTLLFIGYCGYVLISRKWDVITAYFFQYFFIIYLILSNLKYTKVIRYLINLDMVINLFSVLALYELFRQRDRLKQYRIVFASALVLFFFNYQDFHQLFVRQDIYDPVSYRLLAAKKIIPYP